MQPTAMALKPPDFAVPTMKFTGAQRRLSSTMIPKSLRRSIFLETLGGGDLGDEVVATFACEGDGGWFIGWPGFNETWWVEIWWVG